jgi:hypothetical protein
LAKDTALEILQCIILREKYGTWRNCSSRGLDDRGLAGDAH